MANFNKLYETYASPQPAGKKIDFNAILMPYAQQCAITITEEEIILGRGSAPLNSIPQKNICAIVDEQEQIYIILRTSIYVIDKNTGAVNMHIRNL